MQGQKIVHVDAFADRPFRGNAAAVVVLREERSKEWMQCLAQETNLAATVYLWPKRDAADHDPKYCIRWFTPASELPLCGHGTLAAAHVLWTEGYVHSDQDIQFWSQSHALAAAKEGDWMFLDFPAILNEPVSAPAALLDGLKGQPRFVGKSHHSYLVELASEEDVRTLTPDIGVLATLDIANVIVTSRAETGRSGGESEYDFVSRFFAPSHGIAEDHATGSAHCCLAPFWSERLGKTEMTGYQASVRGGVVRVRLTGNRVKLGGRAVTVLRGELSETFWTEA